MKAIKICHVTNTHPRYDGRILYKECVSLASFGYDVTLLVCDNLKNEIINKVKIVSTNDIFKKRIHRFFKSKKSLKLKINEINADVFHLHEPDLLLLAKYLKKKGKKVIFDSHEDYPVLFLERKWIPRFLRPMLSKLYSFYEKSILEILDGVITVSPHIEKRLKRANKNVVTITNYPIINELPLKKHFNKEICFAGGVKDFWNHENIIIAISKIEDIKYKIAGKGENNYIENLKTLDGYNKVEMLGYLNHESIKKIYSEASIGMCICSYRPNVGYKEGSLGITKIFEYMANGLPIICTDFEIFKTIIDKYKCGFYVRPDDVNEIREKIELIINNDKLKHTMSKNAFKAAKEEFNWHSQEKYLLDFYKGILKK